MSRHKTRRANRRAKVHELALFILEHEPNGCSGHTLSTLITRASKYKIDGATLGMLLKPLVDRGNLRKELDSGGFATIVGTAKGDILINGAAPVPPPAAPEGRALPIPLPGAAPITAGG